MEIFKSLLLAILCVGGLGGIVALWVYSQVTIQMHFGFPVAIAVFISEITVAVTILIHITRMQY